MGQSTIAERIEAVRQQMKRAGVRAYFVSDSDPHQSEYLAEHWQIRKWISGFDGSSGIVVITQSDAGLWTDSRYYLQAEQQLANTPIQLFKAKGYLLDEAVAWIQQQLTDGDELGIDGQLFSYRQVERLEEMLEDWGIALAPEFNPIPTVWQDRPSLPLAPIFKLDDDYTGKSVNQKLMDLRQVMEVEGVDHYLLTKLDDIAWLLNLRGQDIEFNPVFMSYLWVGMEKCYFFVEKTKMEDAQIRSLERLGISILPYNGLIKTLQIVPEKEVFWLNDASINFQITQQLNEDQILWGDNWIEHQKAVKNSVEIGHIKNAMIKDGIALVHLFYWLEQELERGGSPSEFRVSEQLIAFREDQPGYFGESFPAIVGYQENGSIIHYRPGQYNSAKIQKSGILLLDSGAQYIDGTTDITRTIALSAPTPDQRRNYTLVLKGHLNIARLVFPAYTKGIQMDSLARLALWQNGLDFGHSTGHGIGFFLNVHEGPHGISPYGRLGNVPIQNGMLISNEPGLYLENEYGIRIENIILCQPQEETAFGQFSSFETLSLFPYDRSLIDKSLLSEEELDWINQYHQKVADALGFHLPDAQKQWLLEKCEAL